MRPRLTPERLAQTLTLAGVIAAVWFYLVARSDFGVALAVATLVGSGVVQYGSGKPFIIPLFALVLGLLLVVEAINGKLAATLIGAGLGTGLPYLVYRLRRHHEGGSSSSGNP
ncbi:hypothetical protein [Meiothermus granaticius]|uniref:Uncharacterized protein n=1 Tax=Meiothermus granaticius NBRC 107808 TaxID=1227551 RepID=A0A399FDB8_9DEIN|nr:hypothetical protein [Meiothermus granaticius]MCL6525658.1 hypothetical protein [Thermaceae bacterium]RIH93765.1 hypothetical protein Mgrana_00348 [Meiothermus granaticius NBRC 107808]GEM85712.1 hypothetical protein MGR01S_03370 [Meiothermus granaticius NBRC 107808]